MNRPHFALGGQSGNRFTSRQSDQPLGLASCGGLADSGQPRPTEIENLRKLMQHGQPMSEERLREYRDKVARGDYFTRAAAESTASRLLDDGIDLD